MKITLPDGTIKEYSGAVSALKIAEDISPRLADAALAAEINGILKDLNTVIDADSNVLFHTFKTEAGKDQRSYESCSGDQAFTRGGDSKPVLLSERKD